MAKKLNEIDWLKLLRVDKDVFYSWFNLNDEVTIDGNLKIKFYGLKYKNNKPDDQGFIKHLYQQVERYVFDEKTIRELKEDGEIPYKKALSYFGDINPLSDGRYGELILYLFVEAVLQTPLVVHKIAQTYNNNDQVKGSDGIFIGNIDNKATLLIGESKMRNNFHVCVGDVIESLSRYIDNQESTNRELEVAKNHLSSDLKNLEKEDLDLIYQSLRTKQKEFKQYSVCYPAFLMYKEVKIKKLIEKDLPEIEDQVIKFLSSLKDRRSKYVNDNLPEVKDITFEFFMMPVQDVNTFRRMCYKIFHNGKEYSKV